MTVGKKKEKFFKNNYPSIARKVEVKVDILPSISNIAENNYYTGRLYINQSLVVTKKSLNPTMVIQLLMKWYEDRYDNIYDFEID